MADDCTCPWDVEEIGGGYVRGVVRKQPDCPGHGHGGIDGEVVRIPDGYADDLRRAKHLTDAELAAEHFSWLFLASHTAFEDGGWSRVAEECSKRAQVLERFATHDQAV